MKLPFALLVAALACASSPAQEKPAAAKNPKPNSAAALANPASVDPKLPRVLLIGDSISIGYTAAVRELLSGKANVFRPAANCGPTSTGMKNLDAWLGTEKWDVIHFNWGLHDLKYVGAAGDAIVDPKSEGARQQISVADYEKNLRQLAGRLKKTGARLIWCSTTPVPEGAKGRLPGDEARYNAAAAKVMKEMGIPTDDLYSFAKPKLAEIQNKADVHFSTAGSKVLASQVAASIQKVLP